MGYFRDDQPLYELILDEAQQRQLDALWLDMDVVGNVTGRMYPQFIENQTVAGRRPRPRDDAAEPDTASSSPSAGADQGDRSRLSRRGRRRRAADLRGDPAATSASSTIGCALVERLRREAEPTHLDALAAFAAARLSPAARRRRARRAPSLLRAVAEGRPRTRSRDARVARRHPDVAGLPLPARSARTPARTSSRSPTTRSPVV